MNKLIGSLCVAVGLIASAHAEESVDQESALQQMHQQHQLGKRPYAKAPVARQNADEKWVGAGIVTDSPEKGYDKHQQMRLHFIGKRPYVGPSSAE